MKIKTYKVVESGSQKVTYVSGPSKMESLIRIRSLTLLPATDGSFFNILNVTSFTMEEINPDTEVGYQEFKTTANEFKLV